MKNKFNHLSNLHQLLITAVILLIIPSNFALGNTNKMTSLEKRNFYACEVRKGNLKNPINKKNFWYGSGGFVDFFSDGKLEFYTNGKDYHKREQGTENLIYPKNYERVNDISSLSMVWLREVVTTDINNDGVDDVYAIAHGWDYPPFPGEKNKILLSSPSGYKVVDDGLGNGFWHSGSIADFNNDGLMDILATTGGTGVNKIAIQKKDGTFTPKQFFGFDGKRTKQVIASEAFDADGDGNVDLVMSSNFGKDLRIYWGNGKGEFKQKTKLPVPNPFNHIIDINFADTDGNGQKEIILLATTGNTSNFYKGYAVYLVTPDGRKLSKPQKIVERPNNNWFAFIHVCDSNNDGKDELFSFEETRNLEKKATEEPPFTYPEIIETTDASYVGISCRYRINKRFYDKEIKKDVEYEVNSGKLTITKDGIKFLRNKWHSGGIELAENYIDENSSLIVTADGFIKGTFPVFGTRKKKKTKQVTLNGATFSPLKKLPAPNGFHDAYSEYDEIFRLHLMFCK